MNDHELLELAANAYLDKSWHGNEAYMRGFMAAWNPLVDDGDALRLAVQQGLEICRGHDAIRGEFVEVFYRPRKYAWQKSCIEYHKDHPDQVAATRRAIVRAACLLQGFKEG